MTKSVLESFLGLPHICLCHWQYADCVRGIYLYRDVHDKWWVDGADFWLEGKLPRNDYRWDERSGEKYGEEYNNLLPSTEAALA